MSASQILKVSAAALPWKDTAPSPEPAVVAAGFEGDRPTAPFSFLLTERLILEQARSRHAAGLSDIMHPRAATTLASWPCPLTPAVAGHIIAGVRAAMAARTALAFVLLDRGTLRPLGWASAKIVPKIAPDMALLNYWVAEHAEGRGLTPEAVRAILLPVLDWTGARRIGAAIYPGNDRSFGVARSIGLRHRGFEPPFFSETRQAWEPTLCYEATREELEACLAERHGGR